MAKGNKNKGNQGKGAAGPGGDDQQQGGGAEQHTPQPGEEQTPPQPPLDEKREETMTDIFNLTSPTGQGIQRTQPASRNGVQAWGEKRKRK